MRFPGWELKLFPRREKIMPGPSPKDPAVRARRNKSSTRSTLSADHDIEEPPLPEGVAWHPMTEKWWSDLWDSAMAPEYADTDIHGLYRYAMLVNDFWMADEKGRREIQVRLEKADADYGTNPMARRRLEWQIETTEDSKARGKKRRSEDKPAAPQPNPDSDPRLKLVQ